ncbi:hypothetical protein BDV95DRAFT_593200 [Massariosphaeria phaeospora]|uniref:RING-type domain-containing protein n=1 Tax=Massariosphaeria phaeospora TaxID=100035 RepID=A0A7C8MSG0_9PLEO|nr:hypothetical protein BDV95DRAFT_593200 [Massariosphaeria phaeospora]
MAQQPTFEPPSMAPNVSTDRSTQLYFFEKFLSTQVLPTTANDPPEDSTCPICYDEYNQDRHAAMRIHRAQCRHVFGSSCLNKWFQHRNNPNNEYLVNLCPFCREEWFLYERRSRSTTSSLETQDYNGAPSSGFSSFDRIHDRWRIQGIVSRPSSESHMEESVATEQEEERPHRPSLNQNRGLLSQLQRASHLRNWEQRETWRSPESPNVPRGRQNNEKRWTR